jgi:Tol biopolymer transport system component
VSRASSHRLRACAVFLALGLIAAGCAEARKRDDVTPGGTIGFRGESEDLRASVYVVISPRTGRVRRVRLRKKRPEPFTFLSYDGTRIWTVDDHGVSILAPGGAVLRRIPITASATDRIVGDISWSSDGSRFVYADGVGLFIASVNRDKPRLLAAGEDLNGPDWSPRGNEIAFVRDPSSVRGGLIEIVGVNGRGLRPIARGFEPDISPDGKRIAFATAVGVFVMPMAGGKSTLVAPEAAHPEWSPDARYLAFTQDMVCGEAGCDGRVVIRPVEGGATRGLGPQRFDIGPLFWTP